MKYYSEKDLKDSIDPKLLEGLAYIEIEDPHGPLIDLNRLKATFDYSARICDLTRKPERADYWRDAKALIDEEPILVEANK